MCCMKEGTSGRMLGDPAVNVHCGWFPPGCPGCPVYSLAPGGLLWPGPPSLAGSLGTCSADTGFLPGPSSQPGDTRSQLHFQASVRPSSLARACAPRSAPGDKEPSVWLTEGVVRPDLCQHRLRTVPGPRCQSSQTEQLARPGLTMGTLGCDPATRLATVPLAQRVAEGHIPETGLRKSCGMATLENGSGPGLYVLPSTVGYVNHDCTKTASPAYSLARRPSQAPLQDTSPGPVYFLDPKVTRFGRVCPPAYSIQGRGKSRDLEVTPGPGAYSPEKVPPAGQRNPPAFTLGFRLRPKPLDTSAPAPNAYTMPPLWGSQVFVKPSSPSFTVGGRTPPVRPPQDPAEIPGPGQYDSPDPNTYRLRRPAFTMLGRPRAPRPLEETPGPGTHSPEQVTLNRARAPAYTMGIRHSKRAATLAADMTP